MSKDTIILSKKGLEKTLQSRANRCVGKVLSMVESVYGNDAPKEAQIIKNMLKEILHQEWRDCVELLKGEHTVLFSNYKDDSSK